MPQAVSVPMGDGTGIESIPTAGATKLTNAYALDFTFTPGSIAALLANVKTVTIPGLRVTDVVAINCTSPFTLGANIANVRVSAADTLEITITTAVALGITLGSLNFRLVVVR